MQGQKSVHLFNASLVSLGLKLAATEIDEAQEVALEITKFIFTKVEHPQIVCAELLALLPKQAIQQKRPRLENLQLAKQKPKGIPTYAPLIDPDFLIAGHFKKR